MSFVDDAIELSGKTGTQLKSRIVGAYYQKWWEITSGGPSQNFRYPTAIVELDAATGEIKVKDEPEIILGSAGHALRVKSLDNTHNLNIILFEKDQGCFSRLKNVIKRRWPDFQVSEDTSQSGDVYIFNINHTDAVETLKKYDIGISLYLFDQYFYTPWLEIENIARAKIHSYYKVGTEFIIFQFTSDWVFGRDELVPLPKSNDSNEWSDDEQIIVTKMNECLGTDAWQNELLNSNSAKQRMEKIAEWYKFRLHKWFRYVLALPFKPETSELYHLYVCSNFERGIKIPEGIYISATGNPRYNPDFNHALTKFRYKHSELMTSPKHTPIEWYVLRSIIKNHQDGICDAKCVGLLERANPDKLKNILEWLELMKYVKEIHFLPNSWSGRIATYQLQWGIVEKNLGINSPPQLDPITSADKLFENKSDSSLDDFL